MQTRFIAIAAAAVVVTAACGLSWSAEKPVAAPAAAADAKAAAVAAAPTLSAEQTQFFESKIRPILTANCYKCHSVEQGKAKGGLTLDTREGTLKGGENG